ncbi:sugar phosphate isomerase/epimerase [Salegentibacter mishustinae]|uniref:sugar phosphate isomerase/epimerase family protein n=1 Tax=Salegentibacter mishustinae TaxID=270918 RepID=UPI001CE175B4|nr:sugar phosphate isomerase/epimerase [Salegentibacter mishustinae]UBZ05594.1 sugar phosphate isomerase/epimerase [Salegentibacter mishustinae]
MKLGIINSAFAQAGVDTKTGLEHIVRMGFDTVDIFPEPMDIKEDEVDLIIKICKQNNLPIASVVVVAFGLVDFNEPVRKFHQKRVKKAVDLARKFGANNVLLVLGEYIWQKEVIAPEDQWNWGVQQVKEIGEYAAQVGIEIALELEPFRLSLLNSVPKMAQFIDDCQGSNIKANIDISHLVLADSSPEELSLLKGKAAHVHISDCDGMVHGDLPPGRGIVKFVPYLQAIKELDFDGSISLELEYSPDPDKIVEWVQEAYDSTDKLMKQVDLRN